MPISTVLPVDASGNKTKVKLQFFSLDDSGELNNGSVLIKYVSAVDDSDLPDTGTAQERRVKQEVEMSLRQTFQKYIDPPALAYVPADTPNAKLVGQWLAGRDQTQLTAVPNPPNTKQMTEGMFLKLVEILQANGDLPA